MKSLMLKCGYYNEDNQYSVQIQYEYVWCYKVIVDDLIVCGQQGRKMI